MLDQITAPFTAAQTQLLNAFQFSGRFHPFTCGGPDCPESSATLIATPDGWRCIYCDYRQGWAHAFMATPLR